MGRSALVVTLLATALAIALHVAPAQAQPTRVFVAAQGSDGNPCTFAAPCRTFQKAHDTVAAGGEVDVLDPAGYGALTITKAISIQGHSFSGISTGAGGTAIFVNAGAGDLVNLDGLLIEGAGIGAVGIQFNSGGSLTVQNCTVRNFRATTNSQGINFTPTATTSLTISNTVVASNRNTGIVIASASGSGTITAALDHVTVVANTIDGVFVTNSASTIAVNLTVTDSTVANNGGGVIVNASGTATASVMIRNTMIANNGLGIAADFASAFLRITQSTVTGNGTAWNSTAGATLVSYADNEIDGNGVANTAPPAISHH